MHLHSTYGLCLYNTIQIHSNAETEHYKWLTVGPGGPVVPGGPMSPDDPCAPTPPSGPRGPMGPTGPYLGGGKFWREGGGEHVNLTILGCVCVCVCAECSAW